MGDLPTKPRDYWFGEHCQGSDCVDDGRRYAIKYLEGCTKCDALLCIWCRINCNPSHTCVKD